jgi:hypothetical protein
MHNLGMLDSEPMRFLAVTEIGIGTQGFQSSLERIDCVSIGEVADCMNVDLVTGRCPVECQSR